MARLPLGRFIAGTAMAGLGAFIAYTSLVKPWHLRWGATDEEVERALPGDELVATPKLEATHAITIDAPAAEVWPWLVQIGTGRGGWYSYDWIENLMGLDIQSAERILPEFQSLKQGEVVPMAPDGMGPEVALLEPNRLLTLYGDTREGRTASPVPLDAAPDEFINVAWTFFLEDRPDGTTRLIERFKLDYNPSPKNSFFYGLFLEAGSFIMERKMLLGIKERAERLSGLAR
jgi:hypothetical protein